MKDLHFWKRLKSPVLECVTLRTDAAHCGGSGVDVPVKSEVRLWDLHAVLKVIDSWVAGMRVGWGWNGVHDDAPSLLEHSCSSRNHS